MRCQWWNNIFILVIFLASALAKKDAAFYTAGVYEHVVRGIDQGLPLKEVMLRNFAVYDQVSRQASEEGVDILVFPEYGTLHFDVLPPDSRDTFTSVPDPKLGEWNPCVQPEFEDNFVLRNFSCMARNNNMVIVFNVVSKEFCEKSSDPLCPKEGSFLYNTNVVFDRNGVLLGRYYKHHSFFELGIHLPQETSLSYFDTDFGRFGTFICFDAFFEESIELVEQHNITNILYPTYWFDHLPIYSAIQTHSAWAYSFDVNFLSSNVHFPATGSLGSGIYSGKNGVIVGTNAPDGIPRLLITTLPKNPQTAQWNREDFKAKVIETAPHNEPDFDLTYNYFMGNLSEPNIVELTLKKDSQQVCSNNFCCDITYDSPNLEGKFYLVASKGRLNMRDTFFLSLEICAFYHSPDGKEIPRESSTLFSSIKLSGNFTNKYVLPSVVGTSLAPVSTSFWNFTQSDNTLSFKNSNQDIEISTIVLASRVYGDDIMLPFEKATTETKIEL